MSGGATPRLYLATEQPADELLASDPLALLIGMLLDQQVPMERAFVAPYRLAERLGTERLDATAIASYDPEALAEIFATPPALHRFPGSMAARTQKLCAAIVESHDGDAAAVWSDVSTGAEFVKRLQALPGFGKAKAQIFAALLAKQFGVRPEGWQEATGEYGQNDAFRSVADITDDDSLQKVREHKQQVKAAAKAAKGGGG
ncbi:MAG TPA: HhH-GPD-type base excision DNA repair protein [Jiangellaceae bacterium]